MYQSEFSFSKAVMRNLAKDNAVAYRIETGITAQGIPDIFVMYKKDDYFIELKCAKSICLFDTMTGTSEECNNTCSMEAVLRVEKMLRPDQIIFGRQYIRNHVKGFITMTREYKYKKTAKHSFVLAACTDGVMLGYIGFNARLQLIAAWSYKEWRGKHILNLLKANDTTAVPLEV